MMETLISIIAVIITSVGFCLLFRLRTKIIPYAAVNAVVGWIAYLIANRIFNDFTASIFASAMATLCSEIIARLIKVPNTLLLMPAIIILVPGGSLYYSMAHFVSNNIDLAHSYANTTYKTALGLAAGVAIVLTLFEIINNIKKIQRSH